MPLNTQNVARVISTKRMREGILRAQTICWCEKQQEKGIPRILRLVEGLFVYNLTPEIRTPHWFGK